HVALVRSLRREGHPGDPALPGQSRLDPALHKERRRSGLPARVLRAHLRAAIALTTMLLDIEGTTTPIEFVHTTLFGYARARVQDFLERHESDAAVQADIALLRAE